MTKEFKSAFANLGIELMTLTEKERKILDEYQGCPDTKRYGKITAKVGMLIWFRQQWEALALLEPNILDDDIDGIISESDDPMINKEDGDFLLADYDEYEIMKERTTVCDDCTEPSGICHEWTCPECNTPFRWPKQTER